jgi:hypothetical protein
VSRIALLQQRLAVDMAQSWFQFDPSINGKFTVILIGCLFVNFNLYMT